MELSGNSDMVWERPKVGERLGNLCSLGNLIVAVQKITYLYFIHTVIHFSHSMFTDNLDE